MKNKLEQLLNSLIDKGWKPYGEEEIKSCQIGESFYKRKFIEDMVGFYIDDSGTPQWLFTKSLREVCSKSSELWQFVCENGMVKGKGYCNGWAYHDEYDDYNDGNGEYDEKMRPRYYDDNFQYRLIESSLKDESELEDFLLNSIKID